MVVKRKMMSTEIRQNLKGGVGDISFVYMADKSQMKNCRLMSEMTVPVGASIGKHTHLNETEFYILIDGKGQAIDNGSEYIVEAGDLIMTSHGESHELHNIGNIPLRIIAIIVTY